ncbi:MAG: hypothetical protein GXO96_08665 [Nitrospirae bacterium]|nr:hypothetical protein [Candidatus Manganitrophaceae bacterium]
MMEEANSQDNPEEKHMIADAVFDFHFEEACAEAGEGDVLRVLIYDMLLPIVDEVFSEVSVERGGYIEQLTIDLGRIDVAHFKADSRDRLRLALKSALEDQLPLLGTAYGVARKKQTLNPDLSMLESFLTKGHFPNNRMFEKGRTMDEILSAVLEGSPDVFMVFLRKMKQQPQRLKRLVYQSSEQSLEKLVLLLSPVDSERLLALVKALKRVFTDHPELTLSASTLQYDIWQTLLDFLLKENQGDQEKQGNIDTRHLMDHFIQKMTVGHKPLASDVVHVFRDLQLVAPDTSESRARERDAAESRVFEALARLKRRLITSIQSGNTKNLRGIWQKVLRYHADLLKSIVLDEGRRIAVRRVLSRKLSDEMLGDIVTVIDPESRAFVHEIVTRPALFMQTNNKYAEGFKESKTQLWEFTLAYLIIERGSQFNKKSYLGSLLVQMAAHENSRYADLLQDFIHKLDVIEMSSGVKSEMRDLLSSLVAEDDIKKSASSFPVTEVERSEKQSDLIQAYGDYETLRMAFFDTSASEKAGFSLDDTVLLFALKSLAGLHAEMLVRFFRTLQVEARGVEAYRRAFSAQVLLKLVRAFVSLRFYDASQRDLMQSVEKYASLQNDLNDYYAQILFCLVQNVPIDFEAISGVGRVLSPKGLEKEKNVDAVRTQEAQMDLLRMKVTEALVQGRPQAVQGFWPSFIQNQAPWLRQALFVYGREAEVRQKLAQTFPDFMLLDLVRLLTPEAAEIVSKLVKQPQLLRGKSVRSFESEKKDKTVLWQYTLGVLLVERGSRFNKKSYLSRLILQMASHRNARAQDILHGLTEGFEAIEISRTAKSEILLMLRELSQEGRVQKNLLEIKVTEAEAEEAFDVEMACRDVRDFLIRGRLQKNDWGARAEALFLKRLNRLFQSHRAQLSRIFGELQSANLLSGAQVVDCSPDIFARLIVIFLSLEHSEAPEFMQAMISHAAQAENPSLYYQKVLFCLIRKNVVDFEAIVSEAIVSENRMAVSQSLEGERDERDVVVSRETGFAFVEKILGATTILSAQVLEQFLRTLEILVGAAPQDLSAFLKKGLEGRGFALRLVQLLPEPLLARLLLLLNPMVFEAILRCSDLIVSAACAKEIALSSGRMTRLKWQFIFQYLFEEGRRFHAKTFVFLLSERLARDAYYSDIAAFRVLLRRELESHHMIVMKDEVLALVEILSQSDPVNSPHRPISKKNVSQKPPPEISSEALSYFKDIEAEWDETIHLENAGLVIAAPYLERFLALLDLTEGQAFKSPEAARRAVHLLQFLVNEQRDSPEYQLVLNKILCGVKAGIPIEREIVITAHEIEAAEGLLQGMIRNWKQIGKTSLQGFRESFLQREGVLHRKGDDWELQVEAKGFDILLDYIPWSFSVVKLPWMKGVIHVKWRSGEEM